MKNRTFWLVLAVTLAITAAAYATTGKHGFGNAVCATPQQVLEAHARSWQGVSLSCLQQAD